MGMSGCALRLPSVPEIELCDRGRVDAMDVLLSGGEAVVKVGVDDRCLIEEKESSATLTTPSGTSTLPKTEREIPPFFGSDWVLKLYTTSSAVIGLPLLNFTSFRSLNVHTVVSALELQEVASHGWELKCWSVKASHSPTWPRSCVAPGSAIVSGFMAAAGGRVPARVVAPGLPWPVAGLDITPGEVFGLPRPAAQLLLAAASGVCARGG